MKADAQTQREVAAALGEPTDADGRRDMERVLGCFAPDPDVVLFGTGADEKRVGREQIRVQVARDWEQTESLTFELTPPAVSASGGVAWASMDGVFALRAGGRGMAIPARVSAVREKRDGRWLVVQSHFSTPAAGQEEGSSV